MSSQANILLVEDEKGSRVTLTALLEEEGYRVGQCETASEALNHITASPIEIVVSDLKLPDGTGLQILWSLKKIHPDAAFILITGHASLETAIEAVNQGAFAYHVKPLDTEALLSSIRQALKQQQLVIENRNLLERLRQALEDVKQINRKLKEKNSELERESESKTQILTTVTHELKTPLTSIIGYVNRLMLARDKVGPLNERQERYLDAVQSNSRRLRALIDDLLDISRIESGTLEIALTDLQAAAEIGEVVQTMRELIDEKQLRLLLNLPSSLPLVRADRLHFSQVISNLLSNACKFSPEGATIAVTGKEVDDFVQFEIADTGIGLSERDQAQVFSKFFRSDNSSTSSVSGTGMGLFITKHLVEVQGGEISVNSLEGKGSTFCFTLPKADAGGTVAAGTDDIEQSIEAVDASPRDCVRRKTFEQAVNGSNPGVTARNTNEQGN